MTEGERPVPRDGDPAPDFTVRWINLAQPRLGAAVIYATDDFFAPKERLILPSAPVFIPGRYDENGKWMDGWESRRRRGPGHDFCIVRLGVDGVIRGLDIDTTHFTGNYPPEASVEAARLERPGPSDDPMDDVAWVELVPRIRLRGDRHNYVAIEDGRAWNHLRLHIYPDGGVARLRVYGEVRPDWSAVDPAAEVDLAALENGGRIVACNDSHFGAPENLLAPGRGVDMGDGWETRRRREPGHDWTVIALGHRGRVRRVEVDTAFFKGNYPERCGLEGIDLAAGADESALLAPDAPWRELLPPQPLGPDRRHRFAGEVAEIGPVTHVRFNIYPDGGVSRLRLFGTLA